MKLVARFQAGVDFFERAASSIQADNGARPLLFCQLQGVLGIGQQRHDGRRRGGVAQKQTLTNDLVVPTGMHPSFLATIRAFLGCKVALGPLLPAFPALPSTKSSLDD